VQPKRGRALIWPSVKDEAPDEKDGRTMHQALPVKKGVKYGANGKCGTVQLGAAVQPSHCLNVFAFSRYHCSLDPSERLQDPQQERLWLECTCKQTFSYIDTAVS